MTSSNNMMTKHSTAGSIKQYDLPKTLLIGTIASAVAAMSNSALASCDSERTTCKSSCYNGWAAQTRDCANTHREKYDDCASIWSQILMTREERDICRRLASTDMDQCVADADRTQDWCKGECDQNWESCNAS